MKKKKPRWGFQRERKISEKRGPPQGGRGNCRIVDRTRVIGEGLGDWQKVRQLKGGGNEEKIIKMERSPLPKKTSPKTAVRKGFGDRGSKKQQWEGCGYCLERMLNLAKKLVKRLKGGSLRFLS